MKQLSSIDINSLVTNALQIAVIMNQTRSLVLVELSLKLKAKAWFLETSCWNKVDWNDLSIHTSLTLIQLQHVWRLLGKKCKYREPRWLWPDSFLDLSTWDLGNIICKLTGNTVLYWASFLLNDDKVHATFPEKSWTS